MEDALIIIKDRLEHDESLSERISMTLQQVCSLAELLLSRYYVTILHVWGPVLQRNGRHSAMGSPFFPVAAELFKEGFEQTALVTADRGWYADDNFIAWPHWRTQLDAFLDHLNDQKI